MDQHKPFRETHNCIGFYGSFTFSPHHWPLAYSGTRSTLLYVALHDLTRHLRLTILSTLYLYARLNYLLSISTFVSILSSSSSLYSPSQWGAVDSLPPLRVLSRTCTVTSEYLCVLWESNERNFRWNAEFAWYQTPFPLILAAILFKWTICWIINLLYL